MLSENTVDLEMSRIFLGTSISSTLTQVYFLKTYFHVLDSFSKHCG